MNYPAGTVAMANSGPNTNSSQFFISHKDSQIDPNYSIWGKIISGMEVLEYVASKGTINGSADGKPAASLSINSIIERDASYLKPSTKEASGQVGASDTTDLAFTKRISELEDSLTSLESANQDLTSKVSDLETKNLLLLADKTALEKTVSELKAIIEFRAKQEAEATATFEKTVTELSAQLEADLESSAKKIITDANAEAARILADAKAKAAISTKKITITCTKGKLTKKVTAVKPVCPTGYKKK
jgi:chromosome segregation ATPase